MVQFLMYLFDLKGVYSLFTLNLAKGTTNLKLVSMLVSQLIQSNNLECYEMNTLKLCFFIYEGVFYQRLDRKT
jgi:hypothetical protein